MARARKEPPPLSRIKEVLAYDPNNGVFHWMRSTSNRAPAGSIAGSVNKHGYRMIRVDNVDYRACRLAWLIVHGEMPKGDIDHINGSRDDDRIANLRDATRQENIRNSKRRSDNTSGFKGVAWHRGAKKWTASIFTGKSVHLGLFDTAEAAATAYSQAAKRFFGEFAREG